MSADYNKPTVADGYSDFPSSVREADAANVRMLGEGSNLPDQAIKLNRTTKHLEEYDSGAGTWAESPIDAETVGGELPSAFADASHTHAHNDTTSRDASDCHPQAAITGLTTALAAKAGILTADTTVNFTSSMTLSEMQALINAQPKNLGGYTLTFQFADGTYSVSSYLLFSDFVGGKLNIYGNTSEADATAKHVTQSVIISSSVGNALRFYRCFCKVLVRNIKMAITDTQYHSAVAFYDCSDAHLYYSYLYDSATTYTNGIYAENSHVLMVNNYIDGFANGLLCYNSFVTFNELATYSISSGTGLYAYYGSEIYKAGTQPTATTSEYASSALILPADSKATQAMAEAGTDNSSLMTSLRTAQAIAAQALKTTGAVTLSSESHTGYLPGVNIAVGKSRYACAYWGPGSDDDAYFVGGDAIAGSGGIIARATDVRPTSDDYMDLGSSSLRFDDVYATNATIQTSDEREKTNITDLSIGLAFINALRTISFERTNGTSGRPHAGLSAQDVKTVMDAQGIEDFAGYIASPIVDTTTGEQTDTKYGLRYEEFIGPLIKAVQELSQEITTLKAHVAELEGDNA